MSRKLDRDTLDKAGAVCRDVWCALAAIDPRTGERYENRQPDRALLAQLRRIGTDQYNGDQYIDTAAAVALWPYKRLHAALKLIVGHHLHHDDDFDAAVAVVISTLAHVRQDTQPETPVAKRLGLGKDGKAVRDDDTARVMAEARFKRLIRTHAWPELLDQGRRIVRLLKRDVNVADLSASLLLWNCGPRVVRDWSFAYYDAEFASPGNTENPDDPGSASVAPATPSLIPA